MENVQDGAAPRTTPIWTIRYAGYALPAILLILVVIFSVLNPTTFPSLLTLNTLLRTESVAAILAIALIFPLVVGEFDLSVGANLGLGAILVTGLTSQGILTIWPAIVAAIAMCGLVGAINGVLVARIGINAMVATLGMSVIVTGSVLWYTQGNVFFDNIPIQLTDLADNSLLGVPMPAVFLAIVAFCAWYVLEQTPFGRYLHAVGSSKDAAALSGLNIRNLIFSSFLISGLLAGFSGVLQAAALGSGNPNVGPAFLLPAFSAAFLGATAIKIGTFNVLGTIVAVFTVAVGITGLQLMGVAFFVTPIFQGVALIAAVTAARFLRRQEL
ncbi:ABC transporter permease [Mesorhizobium cantuariense]|uniref:ABC transporter permease n=1 Tax=Mesorhizobium cantuariense TaxID=1300275 RepID=A0ABV7MPZ5_9HYPH